MSAGKKVVDEEMDISDEEDQEQQDVPEDEAFDVAAPKYRAAAQIVNDVIQKVLAKCLPGAKVADICDFGDKLVLEKVKTMNKKLPKGLAFPTCVSVNNVVCHFSPMEGDLMQLKENDVVRVDLGVHCDGYIATGATTTILSAQPLTGKAGDAMAAAEKCVEMAMRTMKPGMKNSDVSQVIQKVCHDYEVNPCEGVLSHQLKRFVIDSRNVIIGKTTPEQQVDEFTFGENEVYALDIVVSTGAGKLREQESKPTVFKRNPEQTVMLKRKSSRQTLNEISKFEGFPFATRHLDKKTGRMGIIELFRTGLVDPYPVLCEKQGEFVAQIKTTVFISTTSTTKGTNLPIAKYTSTKSIKDKSLLELATKSFKFKEKEKKKKKEDVVVASPAVESKPKDTMEE